MSNILMYAASKCECNDNDSTKSVCLCVLVCMCVYCQKQLLNTSKNADLANKYHCLLNIITCPSLI